VSESIATYIKSATPSSCYFGFWPGMQDATDGRTQILDRSGKNRHLSVGAGDTYAAVTATARYATINGAAQPTDKSLWSADVFPWDMAQGQSLLIAFTINAAAPGANGQVFNTRGAAGNVNGFSLFCEATGKPQWTVRDGVSTFTSGIPSNIICDGTDHQVVFGLDGTGKRGWGWVDGAKWSNMTNGEPCTATAGSTLPDGPTRWGAQGDFVAASTGTWVAAKVLQLRHMHALVMPYWPGNIDAIVAELYRNPHRPLPARMLPATASA
jgi:hypothetical protein